MYRIHNDSQVHPMFAVHVKNVRPKSQATATDHSMVKGSTSTVYSTPEGGFWRGRVARRS